jgi:hypothetical protein
LAQWLTSLFWWGLFCFAFGGFTCWAVTTQNPVVAQWVQYHIPVLFALLHPAFVCPNGYVCSPSVSPAP